MGGPGLSALLDNVADKGEGRLGVVCTVLLGVL